MTSLMIVRSVNRISTSSEENTIAATVETLCVTGAANTQTMFLVMEMKGSAFVMHATGTKRGSKDSNRGNGHSYLAILRSQIAPRRKRRVA
jgi:hypothetical protein